MKRNSVKSISYSPDDPPVDSVELQRHLRTEHLKVQSAISQLADGHYDPQPAAPQKPRAGDVRYADGVNWNPGAGEGIYRFNIAGAWVFVG